MKRICLLEEPWCPPIPDALDDPTEMEIKGAADKLATMMSSSQPHFFVVGARCLSGGRT